MKKTRLNTRGFTEIFNQQDKGLRTRCNGFLFLAKQYTQRSQKKLGLILPKKNQKLACHRNLSKRIIRESYRVHPISRIEGLNIVVLSLNNVGTLSKQKQRLSIDNGFFRLMKNYYEKNTSLPN